MTPARLEQRRAAGRASYRRLVERAILAHPGDPDGAALHLTGSRRARGFTFKRGITRAYIQRLGPELLLPDLVVIRRPTGESASGRHRCVDCGLSAPTPFVRSFRHAGSFRYLCADREACAARVRLRRTRPPALVDEPEPDEPAFPVD